MKNVLKRGVLSGIVALALSANNSNALNLVWDPSPDLNVNKYKIYLLELGSAEPRKFSALTNIVDGTCSRTIYSFFLNPNKVYQIWCTAVIEPPIPTTEEIPESLPSNKIIFVNSGLNTNVIDDPFDTQPPVVTADTNMLNFGSLSPEYGIYPAGNSNNPYYGLDYFNFQGAIQDTNFIRSVATSLDSLTITNNISFLNTGGPLQFSLNISKPGLNLVKLIASDFVGNIGTNQLYYYSFSELDSDGDGISDSEEIIRGYNPLKAEDKFSPKIVNKNPLTLSYYAVPGNYNVLASTNLSEYYDNYLKIYLDRWSAIGITNMESIGLVNFVDTNAYQFPLRFYRVLPEIDFYNWYWKKQQKIYDAEESIIRQQESFP